MSPTSGAKSARTASPAATKEASLRSLLDQLTEIVFETDANGIITFVNAAWARITGIPIDDAMGHPLSEFVHEDDRDLHDTRVKTVLDARRATCGHEVRFVTADESIRWMDLNVHGESDAKGRVTGLAGTLSDITARRAMEDELRELAYRAEESRADAETAAQLVRVEAEELARERDQAVSATRASAEFIASMAHDLRTPLNGVLGMIEFLLHSSLTEEQRDHALTVRTSAESLVRLVGDIVEFSRASAGQLELQAEEFSVREVVDDVARLLAQKAIAKGISFSATVAPSVPERLRGDSAHLRQVVTNLASNAVRFTEHGTVSVSLSRAPGALADGRIPVRIEVNDTDPTLMAEKLVAAMFAPGELSAEQRANGSAGLGLAISRRLVELMGGTMFATSEPGQGSVVSVEVPLERAAAAAAPKAGAHNAHFSLTMEPLNMKVLVAEDNVVNQKVAVRMLQRWGIQTVVVTDGQAAVEALESESFDLVLMDVLMPRLNGLNATGEIRRREEATGRHTPIVAMTAHGLSGDKERCLEAGMDGFVGKPIQTAELYAELARWAKSDDGEMTHAA